jgi:hypothetical protein
MEELQIGYHSFVKKIMPISSFLWDEEDFAGGGDVGDALSTRPSN